jgi:transposase
MHFEGAYRRGSPSLLGPLDHYAGELVMVVAELAHRFAGHAGYEAIQAIKGVGPIMAAIFVAEIGDVSRFPTARHLCSWAGLTPSHRESDTKVQRGHITRATISCGGPPSRP